MYPPHNCDTVFYIKCCEESENCRPYTDRAISWMTEHLYICQYIVLMHVTLHSQNYNFITKITLDIYDWFSWLLTVNIN